MIIKTSCTIVPLFLYIVHVTCCQGWTICIRNNGTMVQQTFYHQLTLLVRWTPLASYSVHHYRGVCFIESQLNKTTLQEREGLRCKTAAIFVLVKNARASGQRNWSEGEKTGSEIGNSHEKYGLLVLHTCTLN